MTKAKKKKKLPLDRMVYAGKRKLHGGKNCHLFYKVSPDGGSIGKDLAFTGKDKGCILGSVYLIPKDKDGWVFGDKEFAEEQDFEDKSEHIKNWRCEEAMYDEQSKLKKAIADAKKIEHLTLSEIKQKLIHSNAANSKALFRAAMMYLQ